MGRVLTNNVSLAYSIEPALNEAGTSWKLLEPNSISAWGAEISTVARSPINKNRQRQKGTVTDLDSAVEFDHDLTVSSFMDFIEGYCFSTAVNRDLDIAPSAVDGTGDAFTVPALTAAQAGKLDFSSGAYASLIHVRNMALPENNGLFQLDTAPTTAATSLAVTASITDETAPAKALVELAGLRFLDGATDVTYAYSASTKRATLTVGGGVGGFDWAAFGLTVGQLVHVGGVTASGAVQNGLTGSAANDTYGYARVYALTATVLTLDRVDATLAVTSPTSPTVLDLLFGKFVRNVAVDNAAFLERSFQFEAEFPNLGDAGAAEYEYAKGNLCNTVSFDLPLTDKATVTFGFTGTDTEPSASTRKTGGNAAAQPNRTKAFNTTSDIARLRVMDVDEAGLSTDFKSLKFTINNNVSPEKVLGTLGAKYMNTGNFEVDVEAKMLFTNGDVTTRVRENEAVALDFVLKNGDGAIAVDVPAMTLGGGGREYPVNETVLINTTGMAHQDEVLGTSLGISVFPITPS